MLNHDYNPDVLNCLANLSNDEVFTPPVLANRMIDLLPEELFHNPKTTFLDPFCKSGVFLREIVKRLDVGLQEIIPDRQERIDHILHKQVFGIAITELTSYLSRRSVYCSKSADNKYSVSHFDKPEGNIKYHTLHHTWENGKCKYCGASQSVYDRGDDAEQYAYQFIHTDNPKTLFNMKFDVIIGNPPYQLSFGLDGTNSSNALSIYNLFIDKAIKLRPMYIVMITPSRWMTRSAQGISDQWVDDKLNSNKFRIMHDFLSSKECFPNLSNPIKGGVNYFLWESGYVGKCNYYLHLADSNQIIHRFDYLNTMNTGVLIRDKEALNILSKIKDIEGNYYDEVQFNFSGLVSPKHFFDNSSLLTSNWKGFELNKSTSANIKYYVSRNVNSLGYAWIRENQIPKNREVSHLHKVYIPAAGGSGIDSQILGHPFYGEPNSVCSQTYLVIGYDVYKHKFTKEQCENIISYIKTKFFRYLVSIKKKTQNGPRGVYQFVPMQDFSHPWTDEMLYKKYGLTEEEIAFIESMIKPME